MCVIFSQSEPGIVTAGPIREQTVFVSQSPLITISDMAWATPLCQLGDPLKGQKVYCESKNKIQCLQFN